MSLIPLNGKTELSPDRAFGIACNVAFLPKFLSWRYFVPASRSPPPNLTRPGALFPPGALVSQCGASVHTDLERETPTRVWRQLRKSGNSCGRVRGKQWPVRETFGFCFPPERDSCDSWLNRCFLTTLPTCAGILTSPFPLVRLLQENRSKESFSELLSGVLSRSVLSAFLISVILWRIKLRSSRGNSKASSSKLEVTCSKLEKIIQTQEEGESNATFSVSQMSFKNATKGSFRNLSFERNEQRMHYLKKKKSKPHQKNAWIFNVNTSMAPGR